MRRHRAALANFVMLDAAWLRNRAMTLLPTQTMDPLIALLFQPLQLSSALDLHSRITLLEDATRACRAELERRPTHCQEAPPPQPAAAPSSCMLLLLGHDEMGVVTQELCDPLQPLLAVNLGSTAKGLQMPMQAALAQLKQQHQEAEGFAALVGMDMEGLRVATDLRLFCVLRPICGCSALMAGPSPSPTGGRSAPLSAVARCRCSEKSTSRVTNAAMEAWSCWQWASAAAGCPCSAPSASLRHRSESRPPPPLPPPSLNGRCPR